MHCQILYGIEICLFDKKLKQIMIVENDPHSNSLMRFLVEESPNKAALKNLADHTGLL